MISPDARALADQRSGSYGRGANAFETLMMLGDKRIRDEIHYEWTSAEARHLEYSKLQKLLEEHRGICRAEPPMVLPARVPPDF